MTDEFDMIEIENDWIVRCNKIGMSRNDVVELLNIYEKENEQLKSELAEIKRQDQEVIEYLQAYHKGDVNELKKELKE